MELSDMESERFGNPEKLRKTVDRNGNSVNDSKDSHLAWFSTGIPRAVGATIVEKFDPNGKLPYNRFQALGLQMPLAGPDRTPIRRGLKHTRAWLLYGNPPRYRR